MIEKGACIKQKKEEDARHKKKTAAKMLQTI
jgi:hypothetical protein